mgnify:FL=1
MDKLRALTIYIEAFQAKATQLNSSRLARQYMELGIDANEAADWANAGYMPGEVEVEKAKGHGINTRGRLTRNAGIWSRPKVDDTSA